MVPMSSAAYNKSSLSIKIFADGADLDGIVEMAGHEYIKGFTTNPTLMRKSGVSDYKTFALKAIDLVGDRPISFEVFADDFPTMERQALEIASWGSNVNVKIPVTNTKGEPSAPLIKRLSSLGVVCNVTAVFTPKQFTDVLHAIEGQTPAIISVFAGRIADAGVNPEPLVAAMVDEARAKPDVEVLWASPRELYNLFHADAAGCHIITVTNDTLKKLPTIGKDLDTFSLETVEMFYQDAQAAGYSI